MSLVLNEHEWANEMILSKNLGEKPFETLYRVAKYYIDEGYKKGEVRKLLDAFLLRCDSCASLPKWSDTLDRALTKAMKYNTIMIDKLVITDKEMNTINSLEGKQLRRLAFTLLCLAKYYDAVNPECNHWVGCSDSEIMHMANINTSIKRQSLMYYTLNELGLIQFSKKVDNTSVRVCFIEGGEPAFEVTDMRNIGYQYLMSCGDKGYMKCQNCGMTVKCSNPSSGRKQKYCAGCAASIQLRQTAESIFRKRSA